MSVENTNGMQKKVFWKYALILLVVSFILYGKSIKNGYSLDDEFVTNNNKQIKKGMKAIPEIFRTSYALNINNLSYEYRPIVKVSYAIEYQMFGEKPHVSHLINILLYALAVILLFYILIRLFRSYHYFYSFLIVLLFLALPVHSEVVLSLKNRDVLFSFMSCMLALHYYVKYVDQDRWKYLLWGALWMACALFSKKDSLPFVAVIPLAIWFFRDASLKKYGYIFLSFILPFLLYRFAIANIENTVSHHMHNWENPLVDMNGFQRIPEGLYCLLFYLKMFVFPHPLISYYGFGEVPVIGWDSWMVWLGVLIIGALAVVGFRNYRTKPLWLFGAAFFLITISMFLNIVKPVVGIIGERFEFISSLGLCMVAVDLLFRFSKISLGASGLNWKAIPVKISIPVALLFLLMSMTVISRNKDWKDVYTLTKKDTEYATGSAHLLSLHASSCVDLMRDRKTRTVKEKQALLQEAVNYFDRSLAILPENSKALNNLATLKITYFAAYSEAKPLCEKAIELDSTFDEAFFNLALCYLGEKDTIHSETILNKLIVRKPDFVPAYENLIKIYDKKELYDSVLLISRKALVQKIPSDRMLEDIGNNYLVNSDTNRAVQIYKQLLILSPGKEELNKLVNNYKKLN